MQAQGLQAQGLKVGARTLVTGASSQVGWFALPMLAGALGPVMALNRSGRPRGFPELPGIAWSGADAYPGLATIEYLVSLGPIGLAIPLLEHLPALRAVVALSTTSVETKTGSEDPHERQEVAAILQAEQQLRAALAAREIPCCLLRPTLVYGCGLDRNLSLVASFIRHIGCFALPPGPGGLRQPLHAEDLARAVVLALESEPLPDRTWPLCGGSTLAYRVMIERLFIALGKPIRILDLPSGLLGSLTALLPGRWANASMVNRFGRDLVFDDQEARLALAFQPRPFAPGPEDFRLPDARRLKALMATGVEAA